MGPIWFGPAGTADSFAAMGYKKTTQMPEYLEKMGLNAFEYQCGRGVRVNPATAASLKRDFAEKNLRMSLHAPYYISLSSTEEEKRQGSIRYILESAAAARLLGADRVVVHTGSCAKLSRAEALELAKGTLKAALAALEEAGLSDITLCPETMGKLNQLGTLEEVLELCAMDERLLPCIDWGHLNARTLGGMSRPEDFAGAFRLMDQKLGRERLRVFHAHFSRIQYTEKGGEKKHLTFADQQYGPWFEPLAEEILRYGCTPVIICESAGTQSEDAAAMRDIYRAAAKGRKE
ncbi:MAG: TIM barrel protein [Angelakisella sp.]|jgi:deoxyribonuclease-4|nr:TIM barrel protein [Angelakisella sp.]MCI9667451.1 TIM barrel protein [Angelakisella sp.]